MGNQASKTPSIAKNHGYVTGKNEPIIKKPPGLLEEEDPFTRNAKSLPDQRRIPHNQSTSPAFRSWSPDECSRAHLKLSAGEVSPGSELGRVLLSSNPNSNSKSVSVAKHPENCAPPATRPSEPAGPAQSGRRRNKTPTLSSFPKDDARSRWAEGGIVKNRYHIVAFVGAGTFGTVFRCIDSITGRHVVVKILRKCPGAKAAATHEALVLEDLNKADIVDEHHILRLVSHFPSRGHRCLAFEFLGYSLSDVLHAQLGRGLCLHAIRQIAVQMLRALEFLSRSGLIHADVKTENILFDGRRPYSVKLIDFGSAIYVEQQHQRSGTAIQSRFYRAPEVIIDVPSLSTAIDTWSLACVLAELHLGRPLFLSADLTEQMASMSSLLGIPPTALLKSGRASQRYFSHKFTRDGSSWALPSPSATADPELDQPNVQSRTTRLLPDNGASENSPSPPPSANHASQQADAQTRLASLLRGPSGSSSGSAPFAGHPEGHSDSDYALFADLLAGMLRFDPADRLTPFEALLHPFVVDCPIPPSPVQSRGGHVAQDGRHVTKRVVQCPYCPPFETVPPEPMSASSGGHVSGSRDFGTLPRLKSLVGKMKLGRLRLSPRGQGLLATGGKS